LYLQNANKNLTGAEAGPDPGRLTGCGGEIL